MENPDPATVLLDGKTATERESIDVMRNKIFTDDGKICVLIHEIAKLLPDGSQEQRDARSAIVNHVTFLALTLRETKKDNALLCAKLAALTPPPPPPEPEPLPSLYTAIPGSIDYLAAIKETNETAE